MIGPIHVVSFIVGAGALLALNYWFNFPSKKGA
jgi:hypothetical protein